MYKKYKKPWQSYIISECEQSGEQISEGDLTSIAQYSCNTACDSTAALLQTGTSILMLRYIDISCRRII